MKKTVVRKGRTIRENRRVQIPVEGLKVGMEVVELDRPWLETPFILQGFTINSVAEIEEISRYCEWVVVEWPEDAWLPAEERTLSERPRQADKNYHQSTPGKQEYFTAKLLHEQGRSLTRSFMDDVRLGRGIDIEEVTYTVSECVKSVLRNPDAMLWMSKIRKKDEYTSEHCLNVGLLAITFGRHLGASEEDLNKLGIAGMLHDVGKMRTPNEILNKEGALSADEFQVMKGHSQHGRDILISHQKVYHGAIDVAYSHHEALDGSGYPRNIKASGITDFTRIVTICDVYDAITSDRVYRKGKASLDALRILDREKEQKFDARLVEQFIDCIGLYPPGSIVELRSGEVGIVISTNYRHRHLPKVLVLLDNYKQRQPQRVLDLERIAKSEQRDQLIKTVLPNGAFGLRLENYIKQGLTLD